MADIVDKFLKYAEIPKPYTDEEAVEAMKEFCNEPICLPNIYGTVYLGTEEWPDEIA